MQATSLVLCCTLVFLYQELVNIAAVARDEGLVQEMFKARRSPKEEEEGSGQEDRRGRRERNRSGGRPGAEEKNKFALSVLRSVAVHLYIICTCTFLQEGEGEAGGQGAGRTQEGDRGGAGTHSLPT